jgi:hypothetical protein
MCICNNLSEAKYKNKKKTYRKMKAKYKDEKKKLIMGRALSSSRPWFRQTIGTMVATLLVKRHFNVLHTPVFLNLSGIMDPLLSQPFWYHGPLLKILIHLIKQNRV